MPVIASILAAGVGKALGDQIKDSIVAAAVKVAHDKKTPEIKTADAAPVAEAMIETLAKDEKFINATNSEPFYQSGVAWGSAVTALGVLVPMIANLFGFDISTERVVEVGGSIVTIAGILYTLYRRFWPGLRPMFSSKKGT